jgi:hypothetical protein
VLPGVEAAVANAIRSHVCEGLVRGTFLTNLFRRQSEASVNTRTIAIIALVIAVLLVLFLLVF